MAPTVAVHSAAKTLARWTALPPTGTSPRTWWRLARARLGQLAYAIGVAEPVSVMVDTYGTGNVSDEALTRAVREVFPTKPRGIIEHLNLLRPIYRPTALMGTGVICSRGSSWIWWTRFAPL